MFNMFQLYPRMSFEMMELIQKSQRKRNSFHGFVLDQLNPIHGVFSGSI